MTNPNKTDMVTFNKLPFCESSNTLTKSAVHQTLLCDISSQTLIKIRQRVVLFRSLSLIFPGNGTRFAKTSVAPRGQNTGYRTRHIKE